MHVTLRLRRGLPTLRQRRSYRAIYHAFVEGCSRDGFRLIHYSVQRNHLHLLVEASNSPALARAMQGLCVRLARRLNSVFSRTGSLFADRYHARGLGSPREVRNALRYVLCNARRHAANRRPGSRRGAQPPLGSRTTSWFDGWLDPYSSGVWFNGWRGARGVPPALFGSIDARAAPLGMGDPRFALGAKAETVAPKTCLLRWGWRRHGLIEVTAQPGPRP